MKTIISLIVLLALVVFAVFMVKWAIDRSKVKRATPQQGFSGKSNPDDNLFKTGVGTVSGLKTNKEYRRENNGVERETRV